MEIKSEYDEIIEKLKEDHNIEELFSFNETNIQDKLSLNSVNIYKYTELYQKELFIYNKICELKDKVYGDVYNQYRSNSDLALTKVEIEKYYIATDPKIKKVNDAVLKQKIKVDFFDSIRKALEKQSWNMTTYLKTLSYGL